MRILPFFHLIIMKLRLRENSIRLRLLHGEIVRLRESGKISENIRFNESRTLTYTLVISKETKEISARFEASEIVVAIPFEAARNWMETNLVNLEYEQKIGENSTLKILLEKDFACSEKIFDQDNADVFPHFEKQEVGI